MNLLIARRKVSGLPLSRNKTHSEENRAGEKDANFGGAPRERLSSKGTGRIVERFST